MKEWAARLKTEGWRCTVCGCPGKKGYDCATQKNRWVYIKLGPATFKIIEKGHIIESGHLYQLEAKMKEHGI